MIDFFTEEKKAALLALRGKILNQLLSSEIILNGTQFNFEFLLVNPNGSYDPLFGFHTTYAYDQSLLSIDEIRHYLADFGLRVTDDIYPEVTFDFDFIVNYKPQTKLVTSKFLWHTRHELVGITGKDRIKLSIESLYPSFSDEALVNYIKRDGYSDPGYYRLFVSPSDVRFKAVREFAARRHAEITVSTSMSSPLGFQYLCLDFKNGLL